MSKNGNGHRGFWNPVKVFTLLVLGRWMKEVDTLRSKDTEILLTKLI
ncbi:MAG: hypothetical protein KME60_26325 [Cyanomargarita calcarea GSE-NOS-MK-12-04C]|uniref:Uncharacterized protein n=1 Tax=Cyanomargarita calcarea GSE-NOS-MK-12-04C TaxID=2839659 RepID=A0A951UY34_9CYAN|nr:hypothetical protein [Cyanomargarita calcarea GSE-NOS-MK-12-04C]